MWIDVCEKTLHIMYLIAVIDNLLLIYQSNLVINHFLTSFCCVVVTMLAFQAGRPSFNPWSDLYSRS
jgi:hypothetical protein